MADLTQPGPEYNGRYGDIFGQTVVVQRSFMVGAGDVPGVAIVVGAIVGLPMGSRASLVFDQYSVIGIGSGSVAGRVAYNYQPQLVAEP
jgi:hypothetical protein